MKPNMILKTTVFLGLFILLLTPRSFAKTAAEIDVAADTAIKRFELEVVGGKDLIQKAKGILVFPSVIKGGIGLGGEYGVGALRIKGKTVDYYNTISASLGFQLGAQVKTVYLLFMEENALKLFQLSKGWKAGVDGSVALVTLGADGSIDTTQANAPIMGFVMNQKGLMYNLTLEGSKFNKIIPDAS